MNVDSPSDSTNLSSCEVTSKYFGSKGVMDESLSDFHEKKNFANAKNTQKAQNPSTSKSKPKKRIKKIRGQKDIRTVLNKKNELIAYSNDFEKICKQSGIDVDSEQLQLAIALSKSLQQAETKVEGETQDADNSSPLSAQERNGKIRTTLQEYGFVVPEVKTTTAKRRKRKKYRKDYKLLQTTEAEKLQVISDKYSQVLFHNLVTTKEYSSDKSSESTAQLYHIGTNISYKEFKDNNLLYVEDLLEKSPSFVGCLLKNWAEIPGRPTSPTLEPSCIKFKKIDCTQEELDTVLSGDIKAAQDIIKNKSSLEEEEEGITVNKSEHCSTDVEESSKMDIDCIEILEHEETETNKLVPSYNENKPIEVTDIEDPKLLTVTQNVRSCSPDIFDDEVSEIIDSPIKSTDVLSEELLSVDRSKPYTDVMDLTECVNFNSQTTIVKPTPQLLLSQGSQTKRKSNDFMDVTECVVGSSQTIRENVIIEENVDLTQNSDEDNVTITKRATKEQDIQSMDLTQSSDTNEELPVVQISGNKSLDDTIILNEDAYMGYLNNTVQCYLENSNPGEISRDKNINNKSASLSEEPEPTSSFSTHDKASITIESEDELDNHTTIQNEELEKRAISPIECLAYDNELEFNKETLNKSIKVFNMTEAHPKSLKCLEDNVTKSKTESFFEEFVHQHSENSSKDTYDNLCVDEALNNSETIETNNKNTNDDIDLTQETDTSEEVTEPPTKIDSPKISFDSSHLGKVGEVSIDYDELFDDMVRKTSSLSPSKSISSRSHTTDYNSENNIEKPSNSDLVSNSSQNSEAFDISDKELDYSINKSRLLDNPKYNFEFGGISVVDNLPDLPSFRPSTNNIENRSLNRSLSESYLPVAIKRSAKNESPSNSTSPSTCKISNKEMIAKTPKNGEYIIKTDGVTPILDYERMTTPERNAELDKYGIKPFKRKRAVQLLTHLYNQTHPIVESLENLPSPSKRFKPSTTSPTKPSTSIPITNLQTSPAKRKSPRKTEMSKSQKKVSKSNINIVEEDEKEVIDKENDIYDVTSEVPDIRDIECSEEDWVFQKREKAKLHSCRVPLHIAFHNYVYARQRLREAILRYESVNIDDIHKGLVRCGLRYDPKDLLKFMDKKCITVKTADNNGRNKKHY